MKALLLLLRVGEIKGRTRFDVIDMPAAVIFPGHPGLKLPEKVLHEEIHRAPEHVQSVAAFAWDLTICCTLERLGKTTS